MEDSRPDVVFSILLFFNVVSWFYGVCLSEPYANKSGFRPDRVSKVGLGSESPGRLTSAILYRVSQYSCGIRKPDEDEVTNS